MAIQVEGTGGDYSISANSSTPSFWVSWFFWMEKVLLESKVCTPLYWRLQGQILVKWIYSRLTLRKKETTSLSQISIHSETMGRKIPGRGSLFFFLLESLPISKFWAWQACTCSQINHFPWTKGEEGASFGEKTVGGDKGNKRFMERLEGRQK